jgi:hypothetical protein
MMQLSHGLFRSGGVLDPDRPTTFGGGANTGGAVREGDGEAGVWWFMVLLVLQVGLLG